MTHPTLGGPTLRDPSDPRIPPVAGPCSLVLFGVTGDLAQTKLLPALYDLAYDGLLPPGFTVTGVARRSWTTDEFCDIVHRAITTRARNPVTPTAWRDLAAGIRFVSGSFDDPETFIRLRDTLADVDAQRGTGGNHAFYLAIPPETFPRVIENLASSGLSQAPDDAWRRVVIEKPFGHDQASGRTLNETVAAVFQPDDVFRIDHYLGKETVQNILALRFANQMFEPLWNSHYVDHVQITMAEDIGIGSRAGYYDGIGAARDVLQNHLLQLLALVAMEEPATFEADALRAEKLKVLSCVSVPEDLDRHSARGQYSAGLQGGEAVAGYLDEHAIPANSRTETYAALRVNIDNRRWAGVPFYLRTGKRLGRRVTEIAVVFTPAPHQPFGVSTSHLGSNALVIRIQPDEGVTLRFGAKAPGTGMNIRDVTMDFGYGHAFTASSPEAYERLILDVLRGEPPLFPSQEEVDLSWRIVDPLIRHWEHHGAPDPYRPGTWGPASADAMLGHDQRAWRRP